MPEAVDPVVAEEVPAAHGEHAVWAVAAWKEPGGHDVQAFAPLAGAKKPAAHEAQLSVEIPRAPRYLPAPHLVQLALPVNGA